MREVDPSRVIFVPYEDTVGPSSLSISPLNPLGVSGPQSISGPPSFFSYGVSGPQIVNGPWIFSIYLTRVTLRGHTCEPCVRDPIKGHPENPN